MDNVYEKLFNETIEVGDIISQNAINNKVYKSCNYKKDRIIGVCTNVNNNEITISNSGCVDVNIIGIACIGDKVTCSDIPGKGVAIRYDQDETIFNIRSIGKIIGLYDNYDKVKILLDIE